MADDLHKIIHLSNAYSCLQIEGKDAQKFLQGQLTCDIESIVNNGVGRGAYCNLKGRMIALFDILYVNDYFLLHLPADNIEHTMQSLKKYAIFSKVVISHSPLASYVITSGKLLDKLCDQTDLENHINILDNGCIIYQCPDINNVYKILGKASSIENLFKHYLPTPYDQMQPDHCWSQRLIKTKIPQIVNDNTESFLPADFKLDKTQVINFKKGCFMGQEVIARMKYIGAKPKTVDTYLINTSQPVALKSKILKSNKPAGEVVNAVTVNQSQTLALVLFNKQIEVNATNIAELSLQNDPEASFSVI